MKKTLSAIIVILIGLAILLFPEYLENIIGDYFEGSSLVIFAFLVIVVPISIAFEKVFTKFEFSHPIYSIETVKMFYVDAQKSNYKL